MARVVHVNINCSDLGRSVAFYRDEIGLQPVLRTTPDTPQPGAAFGLERDDGGSADRRRRSTSSRVRPMEQAQWDAWMMAGPAGFDGVVIDLLEWKMPAPTGTADSSAGTGFRRLRVSSPGGGPDRDPDGTPLEVLRDEDARVAGVEIGCSDFVASVAFYRDIVGLQIAGPGQLADDRGPELFTVELVPGPPVSAPRAANELGLYRMALFTDDIDREYAALTAAGVEPYSPPAALEMGPGVPALRALFFPDPDGATLEYIELA